MPVTTVYDVADLAGVSIKTVSRVIKSEAHVRPSTKERVDQAIAALNYRPDESARLLASHRSRREPVLTFRTASLSWFASRTDPPQDYSAVTQRIVARNPVSSSCMFTPMRSICGNSPKLRSPSCHSGCTGRVAVPNSELSR